MSSPRRKLRFSMLADILLSAVGALLVFFLPGFTSARALFPEWRLVADGWIRTVEVLTLSLVTSVCYTIVVGFTLGNLPGNAFQASWSDPLVEAILAALAGIGFVVALLRGGFRRGRAAVAAGTEPGTPGLWDTLTTLERLAARKSALRKEMRSASPEQQRAIVDELEDLERTEADAKSLKEAEFAR